MRIQNLWKDRSGNFGIMTALLLVPMVGTAGMAMDFANALNIRNQLYAAADAAAVGSLAEKAAGVSAAMAMTSDGTVAVAQTDANSLFFAQNSAALTSSNVKVAIAVTKTGNTLQSNVSFTATVPTTFLHVIGQDTISIAGKATAQNQTQTYMDFYILIDNTPSMGVGATPDDVALMVNHTSDKCAFACHETGDKKDKDYYTLAKQLKVTMRIDVVREATKSLTVTATDKRGATADLYRMAVYTFGKEAETAGLTVISPLTSDLAKVQNFTNAIDLMTIPEQNYHDDAQTGFDAALTSLNNSIPIPGNGYTSSTPQKTLFFVTDGVGDSTKPVGCTAPLTGDRCQEPIDTSFCTPLKNRGIKIAILYTTYLPLPDNPWYVKWIDPFHNQIPAKLQSCASPGLFFEVSPTQGISDAMNALFMRVVNGSRLTS
ncbi:TadE/TadG family type IV pilus assembly protein [Rhizobium tumorigenes]|uniref:TadE/TadG family type IV pilus assembly protein n=1 Tax=Rhizobium tumorigenes TaxID=2041385 RepID=UPI00241C5A80|nr:pilus assembly protein TadG-related protein [Rhizobium tumorigenes]WFS02572.1 pilus assembly protein TadG-related protein [Rhizobium tumorigenes]